MPGEEVCLEIGNDNSTSIVREASIQEHDSICCVLYGSTLMRKADVNMVEVRMQ